MSTRNISIHLYRQNGQWIICRNDRCENFALLNFITNRKTLIAAFLIGVSALALAFAPFSQPEGNTLSAAFVMPQEEKISAPEVKLTEATLMDELKKQDIVCEKHVMAQAKLESLHLKSYLLKRTNNMFGMRYPGRRQTKAIGIYLQGKDQIILGSRDELRKYLDRPTYAVYASWQDAVADYKMWQDNAFKLEEKYLRFLNGIYAEDSSYVAVVRKMAKHIQD